MQLSETNQLIYGHKKQIIKYIMVWIFGVAWILLGLLSGGKDTFPSYGIIIYYLLWVWVLLLTPAIILLMIVSLVRKTSFTVMWENDQLIISRSIDPFNEDITIKTSDIEKFYYNRESISRGGNASVITEQLIIMKDGSKIKLFEHPSIRRIFGEVSKMLNKEYEEIDFLDKK